jgi:hypothetical protein
MPRSRRGVVATAAEYTHTSRSNRNHRQDSHLRLKKKILVVAIDEPTSAFCRTTHCGHSDKNRKARTNARIFKQPGTSLRPWHVLRQITWPAAHAKYGARARFWSARMPPNRLLALGRAADYVPWK